MMNLSAKFLISFLLLSISFNLCFGEELYGPSSPVVELTPADFKAKVVDSNKVVLVEFYASWCGYCKILTPEWEKAATALKDIVTIAAIDASTHQDIAKEYAIPGFPIIKSFVPGRPPIDDIGAREAKPIVDFALDQVKLLLHDRIDGGGSTDMLKTNEKLQMKVEDSEPSLSVELNEANFDELVMKSKDLWMVNFFAPWCGYSRMLEPEWKIAAKLLQGKVKLGQVDCVAQKPVQHRFKVGAFPTILVFGADKETPTNYQGERSGPAIEAFAIVQLETISVAPPKVTELTSPVKTEL